MHREEEQAIATAAGLAAHSEWDHAAMVRGHTAMNRRSIASKIQTQWVAHLREYAPWPHRVGTILLTILLLLTAVPASAATLPVPHSDSSAIAPGTDTNIVINEIYYLPGVANDPLEFIELYNRGSKSVDLSSSGLHDAVTYQLPAGTSLQAGGYLIIAQDPQRFQEQYKRSALGPYSGRLAAEGETISLYTNGILVDQVSYGLGFPWPVAGGSAGTSIQLLHPSLDNGTGGHWRSAAPTPGRPNVGRTLDLPPAIHSVSHAPASPRSGESVRVTATVSDPDEVGLVELLYQVVAPGAYISLDDPAYATNWTALTMAPAGENSYTVDLPARLQRHRNLIRYRIRAGDRLNYQITVPYGDDPQPNFAYFVYDGEPAWSGAIDGGAAKRATYDFDKMRPLPVYHLIASKEDVADAMFIPDSDRKEGYIGSEYPWRATFVYDGTVYDHISFRARGGQTRYATGKNMLKFNFNRGHRLQAYDNYGRPYQVKWDKLNLSAVIQQTHRLHRGEQGMFESLSFRLFNMSGVEAPLTHFIRLRIIDQR